MAVYEVELEDGSVYEIETEDSPKEKGIVGKTWDALGVPEKMSREGLTKIAEAVPSAKMTGNVARDIALNAPKAIAETIAETAPGFISPESIATAGVLKGGKAFAPVLKSSGKAIASGFEQLSGLEHKTPGVLSQAAKDPSLIFGKGLDKARKLYENNDDAIRKAFRAPMDNKTFVDEAVKAAEDGTLTAEEALEARKALDAIKKKLTSVGYKTTRQTFDKIAKEKFADADKGFQRAIKSENLRSFFPVNKTGGASAFKIGIGAAASPFSTIPGFAMSPVVQGSVATLLGIASRGAGRAAQYPLGAGSSLGSLLALLESRKERN